MNAFVQKVVRERGLEGRRLVALGFSNGANLAASMLLRGGSSLKGAILLSPMLPFIPDELPALSGVRVFIGAGQSDPMVPLKQVEDLTTLLGRSGAEVTRFVFDGGHTVTPAELDAARAWLAAR